MPELITDCPRCGVKHITFSVLAAHQAGHRQYEIFGPCRSCGRSATFLIEAKPGFFDTWPMELTVVNEIFDITRAITLRDMAATPAPDALPPSILSSFNEGSLCVSVGCYNAAGAMFRLCLDLATKDLLAKLPPEQGKKLSNRPLGPRIDELLKANLLPEELHELASVIKDDGNDGAHDGTLTQVEAEDLLDFTVALLERRFTFPAKLMAAKARAAARKTI